MDIVSIAARRHTAKAYDASHTLPKETADALLETLRLSPSSVNSQPWHFIVADDAAGKARIAKSTSGPFAYNAPKVLDASHVVVLCALNDLTPEYQQTVIAREQADGRFADETARQARAASVAGYVEAHQKAHDIASWAQKQTYIAQGFLLLAAATLGVDATPMEGFDSALLDAEFDLQAKGLSAQVIVSLGYHSEADFNAKLPKSRLPASVVFSKA